MQKVYLLLRNNQQTGPYSFDELLQLQLKPLDLVWVEGKSCGWRYPTEVETLKHFFSTPDKSPKQETVGPIIEPEQKPLEKNPAAPITIPGKVFVSLPSNRSGTYLQKRAVVDPIEQKAEALRKRVEAYVPPTEPLQTNYNRHLQEAEEEYTQWIYQKKTNNKGRRNRQRWAIATVSAVVLSGAWWAITNFPGTSSETQLTVNQTETKATIDTTIPEPSVFKDNASVDNISVLNDDPSSSINLAEIKKESNNQNIKEKKIIARQETTTPTEVAMADEPTEKPTPNTSSAEPEMEVVTATTLEKKKTLKEKLGDLFKKPKTNAAVEEPSTQRTENNNGERNATRRSENTEGNPVVTDVSSQVEIKTNKIADSWMIGVKNLKLTLFNRSHLTLNTAKVEVIYYSEQNNLLEKKILSFSNIAPKKSQTVAAPDQRLADHIEYRIISAVGTENSYAKQ